MIIIVSWKSSIQFMRIKGIIVTVVMLLSMVVQGTTLPDLGEASQDILTPQKEKALSEAFLSALRAQVSWVRDPMINEYIKTLGHRLASHSYRDQKYYHFFVVDDSSVNAFAGPHGYICIHTGLILKTKNEHELAAVMAHEIAHVSQRHIERFLSEQQKLKISTLGSLLAAIALGIQNPALGIGVMSAVMAGEYQHLLTFSREREAEADRVGMHILAAAGFDPRSMPAFFERFARWARLNDVHLQPFLRTHPVTEKRLSDAYNRSERYPHIHTPCDPTFSFIQARIEVDISRDPFVLYKHLQMMIALKPQVSQSIREYYTYVLSALKTGHFEQAELVLDQLIKQYPKQWILKITRAEIADKKGHFEEALQDLSKLTHQYPHNKVVLMKYAMLLRNHHEALKAVTLLKKHYAQYEQEEQFLWLLSQVQGDTQDFVSAYQTRAQFYLLKEEPRAAKQQLKMALRYVKDPVVKKEIQKKIKLIS